MQLHVLLLLAASCTALQQPIGCRPISRRPLRHAAPVASDASADADADAAYLRMQLKYALKREDYEEAARIRGLLSLEERMSAPPEADGDADGNSEAPKDAPGEKKPNKLKRMWRKLRGNK